jgi:transposase
MFFLISWLRSRNIPHCLAERAKIVILSSFGWTDTDIAKALSMHRNTAMKWRKRYQANGIEGLLDAPRSGRPRKYDHGKVRTDILDVLGKKPPDHHQRWYGTTVAQNLEISRDIVWRILRRNFISLGRKRSWRVSKDPEFAEKCAKIIWLYMNRDPNRVVVSFDEKTSIQALERATGYAFDSNGILIRGESDRYIRHGTANLLAGLEVHTGVVRHGFFEKKRRVEFKEFMDRLVEEIPGAGDPDSGVGVDVILDNLSTHKGCGDWLAAHPNVAFHFTPTGASWMNLVEVFFGKLTRFRLEGASFASVAELRDAIDAYVRYHNETPKPYRWRKREVKGTQLRNSLTNFCR